MLSLKRITEAKVEENEQSLWSPFTSNISWSTVM